MTAFVPTATAYRIRIKKKTPQYGTDCPEIDRIEEHSETDITRNMASSPTDATLQFSHSLPCRDLAIFLDLLPGSFAKVGNVNHESSDGIPNP